MQLESASSTTSSGNIADLNAGAFTSTLGFARCMAATIRLATPDDLPAIVEIYNAAIPGRAATSDLQAVSVDARRPWFSNHKAPRNPMWVREENGVIVAWLGLAPWSDRAAYNVTAEVGVYVAPSAHGRGHGRALLAHALAEAPRGGLTRLVGRIFAHNTPSLRLFETQGFTRWGEMPGVAVLDGIVRDVVIVGRSV